MSHPRTQANYRDATERHQSMAGVMSPSFRCAVCGNVRKVRNGRKFLGKGRGWICSCCQSED